MLRRDSCQTLDRHLAVQRPPRRWSIQLVNEWERRMLHYPLPPGNRNIILVEPARVPYPEGLARGLKQGVYMK